MDQEGKKFREIKTANMNEYMRNYNRENYNKNKKHIRRLKNVKNLLRNYSIDDDIKSEFGEYLHDCKTLIDILQDFPSHLLNRVLDDLVNDGNTIFVKKNKLTTSEEEIDVILKDEDPININ